MVTLFDRNLKFQKHAMAHLRRRLSETFSGSFEPRVLDSGFGTYFDEFEYFATGLESPSSSKSSGTGTNPL